MRWSSVALTSAHCVLLYIGGCGGWTLFAGGVGRAVGARGDALCAAYMLEAVEDELCLLEVPEVIRCVLLCILGGCGG